MKLRLALLPLLAIPFFAACSAAESDEASDEQDLADFYGEWASEYVVTGSSTVTIEPNLAKASADAKMKRAKVLVDLKNIQIGWFLNSYLTDKEDEEANVDYGGFSAMTRFGSYANAKITAVDETTFRFDYQVNVGGSKRLIDMLPGKKVDGGKKIPLVMGKLTNEDLARTETNKEWYRGAPWSEFDPTKMSKDQLENIELFVKPAEASSDAYLAYDRLFADGEVSIGVHYGWDKETRTDISLSREFYDSLVKDGYKSPVGSYDKYLRTSGPLTKTITSSKKPITVKIWIFHPGGQGVAGPDPDTDEGGKELEADMRTSLGEREVVIFKGHSGPMYGFALANWNRTAEGDLDDSKIPTLKMPSTYQIVFANGCETYGLGESFFQIPSKADHKNLNVITTTSFANLINDSANLALIDAITNNKNGKLVPSKVSEVTGVMDNKQGWGFSTMFGIHGVAANPKYDPLADRSKLCTACKTTDKGNDGDRCTLLPSKQRIWTYDCIDDTGCPDKYTCKPVKVGATVKSKQCVPKTQRCE